ncbi:GFA family protein [Roseateles violae]|uniref:GFA family protein n=1 Tax=Roseateles violae TaxID=3058042 RepID=A0ABT8DL92_9BURK|nr:GFA family protein [Pelomonas sp. PFR6]MDN3919180.1 GFA family protein [Pelomonas sp. PFR6]
MTTKYRGSCHCGRVAFEVDGEIGSALACNCSMCQRKGSLLWFVPQADLKLLTPEASASDYQFNKHVIHHRFCPVCGIHPYGEGVDPKGNKVAAINVRCLEGIDLDKIPVTHFDGRAL